MNIVDEFAPPETVRASRLHDALEQCRRLLSSLAAGRELDDLATILAGSAGAGCDVVTATGRVVCTVGRGLPEADLDDVLATAQSARHFPLAAAGRTVFAVDRGDPALAWYLVVDAPPGTLNIGAMDAFSEFAAVAALVHAREAGSAALLDRHDDLAIAEFLREPGRPGAGAVVIAACPDPVAVRSLIRDALAAAAEPAAVAISGGDLVAHVPARSAEAVAQTLRRRLERVTGLLDGPLHIGICDVAETAGLGGAVRGARQAAQFGEGDLSVTSASALGSAASLFSYLPDHVRLDFVRRVLGPLEDYDAGTEAGLIDTLSQFLANNCSWVRTASAMRMHPNTVRYRISRTEEITGRDLSEMADRVDVHLALELR